MSANWLCSSMIFRSTARQWSCAEYASAAVPDATWFPVGAGSGTCLVAAEDPGSISMIRETIDSTRDAIKGRTVIPFNVRGDGVVFQNFTEVRLLTARPPQAVDFHLSSFGERTL